MFELYDESKKRRSGKYLFLRSDDGVIDVLILTEPYDGMERQWLLPDGEVLNETPGTLGYSHICDAYDIPVEGSGCVSMGR